MRNTQTKAVRTNEVQQLHTWPQRVGGFFSRIIQLAWMNEWMDGQWIRCAKKHVSQSNVQFRRKKECNAQMRSITRLNILKRKRKRNPLSEKRKIQIGIQLSRFISLRIWSPCVRTHFFWTFTDKIARSRTAPKRYVHNNNPTKFHLWHNNNLISRQVFCCLFCF